MGMMLTMAQLQRRRKELEAVERQEAEDTAEQKKTGSGHEWRESPAECQSEGESIYRCPSFLDEEAEMQE